MERENNTLAVVIVARPHFEDHDVVVVEHDGRLLWSARQVGEALAYAEDGRALLPRITGDWSDELDDGTDYIIFRGPELAALKASAPELVDARAPSLLMLTESGVNLVALLSRQPKAKQLRRWLATEVIPALRRTGSYSLPGAAPEPTRRALPRDSNTLATIQMMSREELEEQLEFITLDYQLLLRRLPDLKDFRRLHQIEADITAADIARSEAMYWRFEEAALGIIDRARALGLKVSMRQSWALREVAANRGAPELAAQIRKSFGKKLHALRWGDAAVEPAIREMLVDVTMLLDESGGDQ